MTDLTESRISEIRESRDKLWKVWPFYVLKCWHAEAQATIAERRQLHGNVAVMLAEEWDALRPEVGTLLADLEALRAEREGMKAEIEEQRDELSSYAEEREMLRIIFGCPERARRIMSTLDSLRDRLSAPLDPSSAPSETLDQDFIAFIGNGENATGRFPANLSELSAALKEWSMVRNPFAPDPSSAECATCDALESIGLDRECGPEKRSPDREAGSGTACPDDPPCDECLERSMDDAETAGKVIDLMAALKESLGLDVSHPVPSEGGGE